MNRFLFFITVILFSCHQEKQENNSLQEKATIIYHQPDTASYIFRSADDVMDYDTGYFRNSGREAIEKDSTEKNELNRFLDKNLDKRNIIILNDSGLFHSCRISSDNRIRIDTLNDDRIKIIQKVDKGSNKLISLTINGKNVFIDYHDTGSTQDLFSFYPSSFLYFTFKRKQYFYIEAGILDCFSGSACSQNYYLVYDFSNNTLSSFGMFRVDGELFFGDANKDNQLDFVWIKNDGFFPINTDTPNYFNADLYSINAKGKFVLQKDKKGNIYSIKGNSGSDLYVGDSMKIQNYNWPVRIK